MHSNGLKTQINAVSTAKNKNDIPDNFANKKRMKGKEIK